MCATVIVTHSKQHKQKISVDVMLFLDWINTFWLMMSLYSTSCHKEPKNRKELLLKISFTSEPILSWFTNKCYDSFESTTFFPHTVTYISHVIFIIVGYVGTYLQYLLCKISWFSIVIIPVRQLLSQYLRYWYFKDSFWGSMPLLVLIVTITLSSLNAHIPC